MSKRDLAAETFDWKGKAGEEFAKWNPTDAEGVNKDYLEYYGQPATGILGRVVDALKKDGMDVAKGKVLDIGCSSGGKLSIFESLGSTPSNLYGVDLSPMAIQLNKNAHPAYNVQVVDGYEYSVAAKPDLIHHSGVLCQVPLEDYDAFFGKIKKFGPKYYMLMEGINPKGYEKIPNSVAHGEHGHGEEHGHDLGHHGGDSHGHGHGKDQHGHDHGKDHHGHAGHHGSSQHGHGHGKDSHVHGSDHHGHGHGHGHSEDKKRTDDIPMHEGFHHTNDMNKVIEQYFPGAVTVYSEKLEFAPESAHWFTNLHMIHTLVKVVKLRD